MSDRPKALSWSSSRAVLGNEDTARPPAIEDAAGSPGRPLPWKSAAPALGESWDTLPSLKTLDLVVTGVKWIPLWPYSSVESIRVYNNIFVGTARGIDLSYTDSSSVRIYNNVFQDNGTSIVLCI